MERKGGLPPRVGIPSNIPDSWTIPQRLSSMGCTGSMSDFDEGVILRAHRFRAEMARYRLERGHYMDREHDRADRWYVVPASRTVATAADRSGSGFRTSRAAAEEAERLASERGRQTPGRMDPDEAAPAAAHDE